MCSEVGQAARRASANRGTGGMDRGETPEPGTEEWYMHPDRLPERHYLIIRRDPNGGMGGPPYPQACFPGTPGAAEYVRADLADAALAASEERARRAEEERDEARRRRDAWKARASGYEEMRAALAEKAKDVPVMNFSRLMLIALLKDERAENERLRAALASPTDEEA